MEQYIKETISIDKIDIIAEIDELSNNLEQIEKSVKEISEKKCEVVENIIVDLTNIDCVIQTVISDPEISVIQQSTDVENNTTDNCNNVLEVVSSPMNELFLVLNFLNNNTKVENLMVKLSISLDTISQKTLEHVLTFLSTNNAKFENLPPIKNIVDEIKNVARDGMLDIYDIPSLINIITNVMNLNISNLKIKISGNLIAVVIKLIVHILIELQIIHINEQESKNITKLIDSSILLLNATISITNGKCSLFKCCSKK